MKTVNDFNFSGKKALIRVDFNVPQDENLNVTDNTRIVSAKPTIDKILNDGGKVILMTHLGRPDGKVNEKYSLKSIVSEISSVLGKDIKFINDCIGEKVENQVNALQNGEILLLENLRFYAQEEKGEVEFSKNLAKLADIYVNDAFGTAHRAHASTAVIADYVNEKCFGLLMSKELEAIDKVLKSGEKPVTAILGGSKVSTKITIIDNILPAVDNLIIGGGMAYTFVKALGGKIGISLCENDKLDLALEILEQAKKHNVTVYLPIDSICGDDFKNDCTIITSETNNIPDNFEGMDIGPESIKTFTEVILNSKTILWNGPLGVFEMSNFSAGTKAIGNAIGKAKENGTFSLVGGGDSVAFVKQNNYEDKVSYVSTGGGAMLESLEGKVLPGVAAVLK